MQELHRSPLGWLALIAIVIGAGAAAFAYTAGWFSPERLTPTRLVAALAPPPGRRSATAAIMPRASALPACSKQTGPEPSCRGPRFLPADGIRCSGASILALPIRTRRMR